MQHKDPGIPISTKQELAAKKGVASTLDVNLRTSVLSNHTKLSSKVGK